MSTKETKLVVVTEPIADDDTSMISTTDPAYWQLGALLKWFMKQPDHVLPSIAPQLMEALGVEDPEPVDEPDPAA